MKLMFNRFASLPLGDPVGGGFVIKEIGESAFAWEYRIAGDLVTPDSVTTLDVYAFASNYSRKENNYGRFSLGSGLRSVGYGAFSGCDGLVGNLTLPEGVLSIDDYAFDACYWWPDLTPDCASTVEGMADLRDSVWGPTHSASRFIRVRVERRQS